MTPDWMPVPRLWGHLTGIVELGTGAALLGGRHARSAAAWLGLWLSALSVFFYGPILAGARQGSEMAEGLNYLADTLLLAGSMLLLAGATLRGPAEAVPRAALRAEA